MCNIFFQTKGKQFSGKLATSKTYYLDIFIITLIQLMCYSFQMLHKS